MSKVFGTVELEQFNGVDNNPVYVAIRGVVYDVTSNREMYRLGKGYACFAGRDASRALAKSTLDANECRSDIGDLNAEEIAVLDKWVEFYAKKYPVVGRVDILEQ